MLAAVILAAAVSCNDAPKQEGKPFEELPVLDKSEVLAFFKALPDQDLPRFLQPAEVREYYFYRYKEMTEHGALADGEGPSWAIEKIDNSLFWSDFLEDPDKYVPDENAPYAHPYINLYVYSGVEKGRLFGVLKAGAYEDGENVVNPDKCYWLDTESGKLTPAKLPLSPAYTEEDLTADELITYGASALYNSIKNKKFYNSHFDRGFDVYIEDVGMTRVAYDWNGVEFVRDNDVKVKCINNFGFANLMIGDKVPFDIPGYETLPNDLDGPYEFTYVIRKKGEDDPSLIIHASPDGPITQIEVCSEAYSNIYGIHPGMTVTELLKIVDLANEQFMEPTYVSYGDSSPLFIDIYAGFDEDFYYRVPREYYLGDEKFSPDARIERVVIANAAG